MSSADKQAVQGLPELLAVSEVAAYLGLHRATVVDFARRGKLPAFKVGREWRFRADDIRAWLEQQSRGRDSFARRFDRLWERIRERARESGCGAEDVPQLIQEARTAREMRESSGA
jgi:excisionase family DNA binding protein